MALIEKAPKIGGAGINTGTVPSKTLRETALALSGLRSHKLFGVDAYPADGSELSIVVHISMSVLTIYAGA